MNRTIRLVVAACLSIPAGASAAMAAARPTINCRSAARDPAMPYEEYARLYREACYGRATRDEGSTVEGTKTIVAGVDFTNVPQWSDADIMAQFVATRDKRYLHSSTDPNTLRRMSWLYPDDGCASRADQVRYLAATDGGMAPPYKLYAFGGLRVYSNNFIFAKDTWGFHVAPVVKNSAGQPMVLDAALSPCRPLPWKDWLALMVDDMSLYDKNDGNWGVALADPNAYWPDGPAYGGPDRHVDSMRAFQELIHDDPELDDYGDFLNEEWYRQESELHRNAGALLGDSPPWSQGVCVSYVVKELKVPPNASASISVLCPTNSKAVGGGYLGNQDLIPHFTALENNGWGVDAANTSASENPLDAYAVCLWSNGGTVSSVSKLVTISANQSGSALATCPSGSVLTGGGFSAPYDKSIIVYKDWWKSGSSSWEVAGKNTSTSTKNLISYATCLSGTNATTQAVSAQNTIPGGSGNSGGGEVFCPAGKFMTSGGWFGTAANQKSYQSSNWLNNDTSDEWAAYALNTTNSSQTFTTQGMCLSFNTVNDTDSKITYSGSWSHSSGRDLNDYKNDVHSTTGNKNYFQYTFTGTGVEYITEKNKDEGKVDVYIDNTLQSTVNCYNATRLTQQVVYSKKNLRSGSHTIKVVKKDGTYMLLDALAIYQ